MSRGQRRPDLFAEWDAAVEAGGLSLWPSRWPTVQAAVVGTVITAWLLFLVVREGPQPLSVVLVLVLGATTLSFVRRLARWPPSLTVTAEGLCAILGRPSVRVPWELVESVRTRRILLSTVVVVTATPDWRPEGFVEGPWLRAFGRRPDRRELGVGHDAKVDKEALAAWLQHCLARRRGRGS